MKKSLNQFNNYIAICNNPFNYIYIYILLDVLLYSTTDSQRYYTTKRLIRDLLFNTPNCYVLAGEFRGHLFTGNACQKYPKPSGIAARNPAS